MIFQNIEPKSSLSPYVKSIMTFKSDDTSAKTSLPFFADGFPGLMFHQTPNGLHINPHKKRMPDLFIYGQTIQPIEIEIIGQYQIIVFQLYPFTLKSLFGIDPRSINDNCYDLTNTGIYPLGNMLNELSSTDHNNVQVNILSEFIHRVVQARKLKFDPAIIKAITMIMKVKGRLNLSNTASELNLTKRTFERRFASETGLLPKQFAKIIQFQNSLSQLTVKDHHVLSDVVYANGYADQSHFIRVFKSFTGKTPKQFVRRQKIK